ncbi:MAG: antitoxin Xre/MbcA/ParS toxin-binding domain-containing protein [Ferruginibacter sp.]
MKNAENAIKVYKQYADYIQQEEFNTLSEPEAIYATAFDDMLAVSDYDKDFAADLLDVSHKTVTRYQKEKKKLSPLQSEYILKTIVLFNKGNQVFGNKESFNRWLDKPAFGLGNRIPRAFSTTVGGINFIIDELNRIARGDLA